MDPEGTNQRIVACDTCRSRKLRCDGNNPCERCQTSKVNCLYTYVQKRKRAPAATRVIKEKKAVGIESLDDRLNKLESLMTVLVNKLDSQQQSQLQSAQQSPLSFSSSVSGYGVVSAQSTPNSHTAETTLQGVPFGSHSKEQPKRYFGAQSSFSFLGPRGFAWLVEVSGEEAMLNKFVNLYKNYQEASAVHIKRWTESFDRSCLVPFPPKETVLRISNVYFREFGQENLIIDVDEFQDILSLYYDSASGRQDGGTQLTSSDFLILNSVIAIGALMLTDEVSLLDPLLQQYRELHEAHLSMALYYYHKICIVSEGLRTIQGVLLLILNADFCPVPQMSYALVNTAVRYAQDIGLHRAESLTGLPRKQAATRYRLWFTVHFFDSSLCLKGGKPPIINSSDVTHLISDEDSYEFVPKKVLRRITALLDAPEFDPVNPKFRSEFASLEVELRSHPVKMVIMDHYAKLINHASYTYDRIFKAKALLGKNMEEILDIIARLNERSERIRLQIPKSLRPDNKGLNESYFETEERHDYVMLHMQYHLQILVTNRMAFKRAWLNDDLVNFSEWVIPKQKKLMAKCLDSARVILRIYLQLNSSFGPLFYNYTSFYFSSAFYALFVSIIEYPNAEYTKSDIMLIQETMNAYFEKVELVSQRHPKSLTTVVYFISMKLFTKIAISVYNKNNKKGDIIDTIKLDNELDLHNRMLGCTTSHELGDIAPLGQTRVEPLPPPPPPAEQQYHERQNVFDPVRQSLSNVPLSNQSGNLPGTPSGKLRSNQDITNRQSNIHPVTNTDVFNPSYSFNDPPLNVNITAFDHFGFAEWELDTTGQTFNPFNLPLGTHANSFDPTLQDQQLQRETGNKPPSNTGFQGGGFGY